MTKKLIIFLFGGLFSLTSFSSSHAFSSKKIEKNIFKNQTYEQLKDIHKEEKALQKQKQQVVKEHYRSVKTAKQKNELNQLVEKKGFISFNSKSHPETFFLSNDYPVKITVINTKFDSAESAFQALRFSHLPKLIKKFQHLDADQSKKLAQQISYEQLPNWHHLKEEKMLDVLRAKFSQHTKLKNLLLATGDAYLVFHDKHDIFWGDGKDGSGKNRLGYLLMQIRSEFGGIGVVSKPKTYRKFVK